MQQLDFLFKNRFRNFPLQGNAPVVTDQGFVLPTRLLVGLQLTSPIGYSGWRISKITVGTSSVNMLVLATKDAVEHAVAVINGAVTSDNTRLLVAPIISGFAGSAVIGTAEALVEANGTHTFTAPNGVIEQSLVTCIPLPAVESLEVKGQLLRGNVRLSTQNIQVSLDGRDVTLDVVNRESVRAKNDRSVQFRTCPGNVVGTINGVTPDENGNIDIYGIDPVKVQVAAEGLILTVDGISMDDVCATDRRLPPLISTSNYQRAFHTAKTPEWMDWPNYKTP